MKISNINLKKATRLYMMAFKHGVMAPNNHRCSNAQPKFYPGWNDFVLTNKSNL